uniref:uncharacterized protein LOC101293894 isoform X2 n=1 Tax=Fragaria vesca subsp. vesca TaxID=101020 RepID=UPI0005CAE300|nr:PREDICTED: uncharacterized protein LOC101293894 isoform X2 [Fragaria vesca subsp. vesca]
MGEVNNHISNLHLLLILKAYDHSIYINLNKKTILSFVNIDHSALIYPIMPLLSLIYTTSLRSLPSSKAEEHAQLRHITADLLTRFWSPLPPYRLDSQKPQPPQLALPNSLSLLPLLRLTSTRLDSTRRTRSPASDFHGSEHSSSAALEKPRGNFVDFRIQMARRLRCISSSPRSPPLCFPCFSPAPATPIRFTGIDGFKSVNFSISGMGGIGKIISPLGPKEHVVHYWSFKKKDY